MRSTLRSGTCDAATLAESLPTLEVAYLGQLTLNLDHGDPAIALAKDDVEAAHYWSGLARALCHFAESGACESASVRRPSGCQELKQTQFDRMSVTSPAVDKALSSIQPHLLAAAEKDAREAMDDYQKVVDQM